MRIPAIALALLAVACSHVKLPPGDPALLSPGETRIANLRQLTHGGTNAEAYWSFDGEQLSFQHKAAPGGAPACDRIYSMRADGSAVHPVSNGEGRTTCAFFYPDGSRILYSSTMGAGPECPPAPDLSHGYVWPVYNSYQIYASRPDGSDPIALEPGAPRSYNAEATFCHDGSVVFTSDRDGDLELYTAKLEKLGILEDVKRVTNSVGYDGGAVFSPDCKQLVWRASRPRAGEEFSEYKHLLKKHLVKPTELELWIGDADGSHARQLTRIGAASFAPAFTPDGKHVVFASNPRDPHGRSFDLYTIAVNGTRLERVTFSGLFDSFPMFSPDGRYLAFSSNRHGSEPHETNVFVADWVAHPDEPLGLDATDAADRYQALVERLASPELEGRKPGTPGMARAEDIVAGRFAQTGLAPLSDAFAGAIPADGFKQEVKIRDPANGELSTSHNVVGTLGHCGAGAKPVVVGAHLDHLGRGGSESLEPSARGIHFGADDNASGVAAVLEAARVIGATSPRECFLFAAFTGEEIGVAGSSFLAKALTAAKIHPKAMLNMDMVGRLENNRVIVYGTDSAREWKSLVEAECADHRLSCPGGGDGYGPSDHMSFFIEKSPVLHFFTGPHADYHRVTDTADKVNATGGVQVAELVAALALRAARTKLHFVAASSKPSMGVVSGREKRGNGAYLGTIPDYASLTSPHGPSGGGEPGGGVKLAGTRQGSPAEKAGVVAGDVLLAISDAKGSHPIATLEGFMGVLLELHPGDAVKLVVQRGDKRLELDATVGKRD
jgi:Tol biopolymer transport system component